MKRLTAILLLIAMLVNCAPGGRGSLRPEGITEEAGQLHLGNHTFDISTSVPEAQAAFNRGMTLSYGFSHATAEREFRRAAELDPTSPMPWWGVALVNGPHINYPLVPEDKAKVAWEALGRAKSLAHNGNALEKDLIRALGKRYVKHQGADRSNLDLAYSKEMKKLAARYPTNDDVLTLYAESLMDLHPWDFWETNGLKAKPWTFEVVEVLERAIALNSEHPGANHLYIHTMEASSHPEIAEPHADRLLTLVPAAGHLVHMPAHIYARVGRWDDASRANELAVVADEEYRKSHPDPGFYAIYMLHNNHFLAFARMMQGNSAASLAAARAMLAGVPPSFLRDFGPIADGYMAIELEVLMRFGRWEEILKQPEPQETMPFARALWRFTRGVAFTALDRRSQAEEEKGLFLKAIKRVPKDATFGNNSAHTLLTIANKVLDGEMAARSNQFESAIRSLRAAASIEDTLTYDEPPDWILPVRHTLGVTLLRAGKPEEAETVYREELRKFPGNIWSLSGLYTALEKQGKRDEAAAAREHLRAAEKKSDAEIHTSCLCQPTV